MKKVIPQKVANKVFDKMLSGKKNRFAGDWIEETLYRPGTAKISNKFFKSKITTFIYRCRCEYCVDGKQASTRRNIEKLSSNLYDYLQNR